MIAITGPKIFCKGAKPKLESKRLRLKTLSKSKKSLLELEALLLDPEIKQEWIESGLWRRGLLKKLEREWTVGAREWRGKVDRFMRLDLVLIEKKTSRLIGHLPLSWNQSDQSIEIGFFILGEKRHQGFAREAVLAIIDWADKLETPPVLYSWATEKNRPSRKLLRDLGFKPSPKYNFDGNIQRCYYRDPVA